MNHGGQSLTYFKREPLPLEVCTIRSVGTLSLTPPDPPAPMSTPEYVVIHPSLPNAYVTDDGLGQVDEIGLNGLSFLGSVQPRPVKDIEPAPYSIVMHPSGNFLYTGSVKNGIISEFSIAPTTGLLTWQSNETVGVSSPVSLAIDASGNYLYAANSANSELAMFAIDPGTGALSPIGTPNTLPAENPPNPASSPFSIAATH